MVLVLSLLPFKQWLK